MGLTTKNIACISLWIILVLTFSSDVKAQHEKNKIIKKYSIKDGLSQAVVNSIVQDDKGWMWFATDDGLNRFDGYSFTSFKFDKDGPTQFHDNFVQRVFKDSRGKLWVSSRRGLYRFNVSTQNWNVFVNKKSDVNNDVSYISEDSTGKLWIGWYLSGIGTFDPTTESYDTTGVFPLKSTATIAVFQDSYGLIWAGSQHKGVDVFQYRDSGRLEKMAAYSVDEILPSQYVKCFQEDHQGNIWIGTTKGLVVFIRGERRFEVLDKILPTQCGVFSLLEDKDKTMWIGTRGNGMYTVNLQEFDSRKINQLASYHVNSLDEYDLSQHTIRSIFQDRNGNIWIGTHGDGVYMVSHEAKNFMKIQVKRINGSAESLVPFHGLCNDDDGNIWVGTDGEGIYKFNADGELLKHYQADGKRGSIGDDLVYSALRDYQGDLWFGTYSHGVYKYNKNTDSFTQYPHSVSDTPVPLGNRVPLLFQDSRMNIWVGASRGGLCLIDKIDKTFKRNSAPAIFNTIDVRAMTEDKQGRLWMGCYGNGVLMYSPDTKEVEKIMSGTDADNPLKSNIVYALAIDKDNVLWIGSSGGGLGSYDMNDKTFKRYTDAEGLINNTIFGLQIDEQQNVWCSTISGISKYDKASKTFINYTSNDGLQAGQFNPGSALKNQQRGYICFGGAYGFNLFYPLQVNDRKTLPDIRLSGFQLFNKAVRIGGDGEDDILEKVIDETKSLTLKHNQASFTIEFTALDYSAPEKCEYAYKLENFDADWIDVGNQRTASYRYLPPGTYEFKVKATNQRNFWPSQFAHVNIVVAPPLWRTTWAYLAYLFIAGLIAFGIVSIRKRQAYLKKRVKSERHKRRRERQLVHDKLAFFTEVSHEFRTPLTLIIGPLEEMMSKETGGSPISKKLRMVNKNAHKLLSLINKLLDYRKIESGKMVLTIRKIDMVAFIEEIFINFKELANRPTMRFEFYTEEKSLETWFDGEKMEMVLTNIISNSFKYLGEGNAISISVKKEIRQGGKAYAVIAIKDNGIGIPKDQLKYIFDWFYNGAASSQISSGIGLALAKKLVYLHKGEIYVESEPGEGSRFTVKIPLGRDHFEAHEVIVEQDAGYVSEHELIEHDVDDDEVDATTGAKKGLKTVLIVEDDDDVRSFLKDYLSSTYRVIDTADGSRALEIATASNPDLIVSDIMMPGIDGMELCSELKHNIKTSHIPVILLTAKSALSHHKAGLETGADAYLTKPFSPEILTLTISNLLQARENSKRYYRSLFLTDDKPDLVSTDEKLLQKIFEIVKVNMNKTDLSVDTVSHEVGLSKSILYKKVKQLTGLSPIEYMRSLRLSEAAKLLRTQQYKVYEVVYLVGFSDLKYFRKCFVKEFGYPPSQLLDKQL